MLNFVFIFNCYPLPWCVNELVVLFKCGDRLNCSKLKGMSVLDTLAQGYDSLWVKRLSLWGSRCQAGGQRGRGCVELIVRLLCDYAVYRRTKFFVLFIDFCKAYDEAPRKLPQGISSIGVRESDVRGYQSCVRVCQKCVAFCRGDCPCGCEARGTAMLSPLCRLHGSVSEDDEA